MESARDQLTAAFGTAEARGFAYAAGAVAAPQLAAIESELSDLTPTALEPEVGPVRQSGAVAVAAIAGRPTLDAFADHLAVASGGWRPDELAFMTYGPGEGITPHRDNTFYDGFVVVVGLAGTGRFAIVNDRAGTDVVAAWDIGAGDVVVFRGPDPEGNRDRPMHTVIAGDGGRRSLTLRRNRRGAGRGWS